MDKAVILVCCAAPDREIARKIACALVEQKLAACVSTLPEMQSVYRWQGHIEEAEEILLLIKTTQVCYAEMEQLIVSLHPYEVPEIIKLSVQEGLPAYMAWVAEETTSGSVD